MIRPCRQEEEDASWDLEGRVWATFHQEAEGGAPSEYFHHLHLLATENKKIVGTIDACPLLWDEDPASLEGWAEMVRASDRFPLHFRPAEGDDLWAGAIGTSIDPAWTRGGLSRQLLQALKEKALQDGYRGMLAPVRPVFYMRAPYLSIEEYADMRLPDGRHFDPWVRTHEDIGGQIIATRERSASFRGSRHDWERWSGIKLPSSGKVIISGAAGPLILENDIGEIHEPSIWILHT